MKFFLPFLYFLGVIPVAVVLVAALAIVEGATDLEQHGILYFNADVSVAALLIMIGSPVFGAIAWMHGRLEEVSGGAFVDHLHRCAFLYVFVGILGAMFAAEYIGNLVTDRPMYELPKAGIIWAIAAYAILVDALVLVWRRFSTEPGGAA